MNKKEEEAFDALHECCMNATGAYEALDMLDAARYCPVLVESKDKLEKALILADNIRKITIIEKGIDNKK